MTTSAPGMYDEPDYGISLPFATAPRPVDALGVIIRDGDSVTVVAWGAPVRLTDTGRRAQVVGFTRAGNVRLSSVHYDPIAGGRAVSPDCLAVNRRDGQPGYEGNRVA